MYNIAWKYVIIEMHLLGAFLWRDKYGQRNSESAYLSYTGKHWA